MYKSKNLLTIYKIICFIFGSIALIFTILFFIKIYISHQKEQISKQLLSSYTVSTLFANVEDKNITNDTPFVIGIIKIDKINLNYPILSHTNNDLLDISLCRFAGPMPNEIGNLCIAGHNYVDYKFFSRLHELKINDKFKIYDLSGKMVEYIIKEKYETFPTDTSCTIQNTNGEKIVTLLTCNNVTGKRLVLKAIKYTL